MYIADANTKNLSEYLIDNNINNYNWFQKIDNDKLSTIDPYDENLSDEYKNLIIEECKYNPIYFFRDILRLNYALPAYDQCEIVNFKLTKNSIAKIYLELYKNKSVIELDPRLSSKTITALAIAAYKYLFSKNENIYIISTSNKTNYDLEIIKRFLSSLPSYLKQTFKPDKEKLRQIYNKCNNNKISTINIVFGTFDNVKDKIANKRRFYEFFLQGLNKPTHFIIDDIAWHKDFNYIYNSIDIYRIKCNTIVDITSATFQNSPFIEHTWKLIDHWNESIYDRDNFYIPDIVLLHYEPDELFDKDKIIYSFKAFCINYDKETLKQYRYEMCIRPFDSHFRIKTYLKKLGIKI